MKVCHLTNYLSSQGGGIPVAIAGLSKALALRLEKKQRVYGWANEVVDDVIQYENVKVLPHLQPSLLKSYLGSSCLLKKGILSGVDVVHTHGLWSSASLYTLELHRQKNVPFVVSPHGMLDTWALKHAKYKKKAALCLFEKIHLERAACIHALCCAEADAIRSVGIQNSIEVIPNGVDLPSSDFLKPNRSGRKKVLFLGRLHHKKGLVQLVEIGAKLFREKGWQIVIAGWDQSEYLHRIKGVCKYNNLRYSDRKVDDLMSAESDADILYVGSVFGAQKTALLSVVDAFVLPSFSEGLPMAVLEAWAHYLPVLMTEYCNLSQGFTVGGAHALKVDHSGMCVDSLREFLEMSDSDLKHMGAKGRKLVEEQFSWDAVADSMHTVYQQNVS